jgi:cytochrome b561
MSTQSVTVDSGSRVNTLSSTKRYHPALVALHWLIAILIFGAALLGGESEGGRERFGGGRNFPQQPGLQQPGTSPQQGFPQGGFPPQTGNQSIFSRIGIHMILGIAILVLLVIRLAVRWTTKHPDWASAGNKFFDWVGNLTHWGLYVLTFAMTITGIILASQRGQLARVLGIGTFTSGGFRRGGFSLGSLHGGIWILLLLLIVLHIGAALYHQFILKDNLLSRMWFGKQTE